MFLFKYHSDPSQSNAIKIVHGQWAAWRKLFATNEIHWISGFLLVTTTHIVSWTGHLYILPTDVVWQIVQLAKSCCKNVRHHLLALCYACQHLPIRTGRDLMNEWSVVILYCTYCIFMYIIRIIYLCFPSGQESNRCWNGFFHGTCSPSQCFLWIVHV